MSSSHWQTLNLWRTASDMEIVIKHLTNCTMNIAINRFIYKFNEIFSPCHKKKKWDIYFCLHDSFFLRWRMKSQCPHSPTLSLFALNNLYIRHTHINFGLSVNSSITWMATIWKVNHYPSLTLLMVLLELLSPEHRMEYWGYETTPCPPLSLTFKMVLYFLGGRIFFKSVLNLLIGTFLWYASVWRPVQCFPMMSQSSCYRSVSVLTLMFSQKGNMCSN